MIEEYIKENYMKKTKKEIANYLGLTYNQVEFIARKLNLRKYRQIKYTEEELSFIKDNYPRYGSKYCAIKLGRNENAINKKIKKMGLNIKWKYFYVNEQGYLINCQDREHKYAVHRKVMETKLGRKLSSNEIVHHIDGNKLNNDPDNLMICSRKEHINIHRKDLQKSIQDIV